MILPPVGISITVGWEEIRFRTAALQYLDKASTVDRPDTFVRITIMLPATPRGTIPSGLGNRWVIRTRARICLAHLSSRRTAANFSDC